MDNGYYVYSIAKSPYNIQHPTPTANPTIPYLTEQKLAEQQLAMLQEMEQIDQDFGLNLPDIPSKSSTNWSVNDKDGSDSKDSNHHAELLPDIPVIDAHYWATWASILTSVLARMEKYLPGISPQNSHHGAVLLSSLVLHSLHLSWPLLDGWWELQEVPWADHRSWGLRKQVTSSCSTAGKKGRSVIPLLEDILREWEFSQDS